MSFNFFTVRKFAWYIIKKYNLKIPIDLDFLLKELDIDIEWAFLPQNIDGAALPGKFSRGLIVLNTGRIKTRERFTIAHEIGHILWHYPKVDIEKTLFLDLGDDNSKNEREANVFATELLMPRKEVIKAFYHTQNISELAEFFQVSKQAMSIRLEELKLA